MSIAKDVTDATFTADVLRSDKTVLVDFWAAWCGPCRAVSPVLDQIAAEHSDEITVAKVNVDLNPDLADRYGVVSIPTLMVFRGGTVQKIIIGARPKADLERELQEFLRA
ncbi:thioredoxin [Streptomyces chartreusis]|uniref:thioredoxin n=1 Tax=Streptomyces chartreusis TaxID=1969 RepID=UPI003637B2AE